MKRKIMAALLLAVPLVLTACGGSPARHCVPADAPSLTRLTAPTYPEASARAALASCLGIPAAALPQFVGAFTGNLEELVNSGAVNDPANREHFLNVTVPQLVRQYGK